MDATKLELLLDRAEISDLLIRYTTDLDTKDWELLHSCFTETIATDFSSVGGPAAATTQAGDFIAFLRQFLGRDGLRTQHLSTNHVICIDCDSATCVSYIVAQHHLPEGSGDDFIVHGYYTDALARTPQGWRISKRKFTLGWTTGNPQILKM